MMDGGGFMKDLIAIVLFFAITVTYIVIVGIIQHKLTKRLKGKGQQFKEEAEQDGRKVTAYLDHYDELHVQNYDEKTEQFSSGETEYIATYYYVAPNGKKYKMHELDCHFKCIPSEERTLYLHLRNYHKYYKGNMSLGKHPNIFMVFTVICWIGLYYWIMTVFVAPVLLH